MATKKAPAKKVAPKKEVVKKEETKFVVVVIKATHRKFGIKHSHYLTNLLEVPADMTDFREPSEMAVAAINQLSKKIKTEVIVSEPVELTKIA